MAQGKQIRCGDVVPGCAVTLHGETEEEVLAKVADHAKAAHGLKEVTPQLLSQVKAAVRDR